MVVMKVMKSEAPRRPAQARQPGGRNNAKMALDASGSSRGVAAFNID